MKKQDFIVLSDMFPKTVKNSEIETELQFSGYEIILGIHFEICRGVCIYFNKCFMVQGCKVLNDHNFTKSCLCIITLKYMKQFLEVHLEQTISLMSYIII